MEGEKLVKYKRFKGKKIEKKGEEDRWRYRIAAILSYLKDSRDPFFAPWKGSLEGKNKNREAVVKFRVFLQSAKVMLP
jgi:hypothetical protein